MRIRLQARSFRRRGTHGSRWQRVARFLRVHAVFVAVAVGLLALSFLALGSAWQQLFVVHKISISRSHPSVPVERVEEDIQQLLLGVPLWRVPKKELTEKITTAVPSIKEVEVTRVPPSSVAVHLVQFPPVAGLRVGEETFAINERGQVAAGSAPADALVFSRMDLPEDFAEQVVIPPNALQLMEQARLLIDTSGWATVTGIAYHHAARELRLGLSRAVELYVALDEDLAAQIDTLSAALATEPIFEKAEQYIDLRIPHKIFFR